ncbi:MAG: site-specific DNA-methyltransferase [Ktedonobacteraceae bacterium]|nr:site-specific DNA-methyltransferase [Ktedonobacteraceae bacterium]
MVELVWENKHNPFTSYISPSQSAHSLPYLATSRYYPLLSEQDSDTAGEQGWVNRLVWSDKNDFLLALLADLRGMVDLIYIDPPFMTGRTFAAGQQLAFSDHWNNNMDAYLQWLYETLLLLYELLADDGSLYIHLDWRCAHYARIILDEIFGSTSQGTGPGFKNEIIWHYRSGGRTARYYARKHDTLLLYTKSARYCFHSERVARQRGAHRRNHMRKLVDSNGHISWTIRSAGRTYTYDEEAPMQITDVWSDISHLHQRDPQRTGYTTQKPEALLERIIQVSSEEQDLVLDCFCGSGVTPIVAERLGRRWLAGDSSALAISTTCQRLLNGARRAPFVLQYAFFPE